MHVQMHNTHELRLQLFRDEIIPQLNPLIYETDKVMGQSTYIPHIKRSPHRMLQAGNDWKCKKIKVINK